jgi:hypothetical protein
VVSENFQICGKSRLLEIFSVFRKVKFFPGFSGKSKDFGKKIGDFKNFHIFRKLKDFQKTLTFA